MCTAKMIKHPVCKHWSCELVWPCAEGKNLKNCPRFKKGLCNNPSKYPSEMADEKECPKCDKKDEYDSEKVRMIKNFQYGGRIGLGPNETNMGFDRFRNTKKFVRSTDEAPTVICCAVM